jgi:sialic acid synthase SpsE
VIAEAGVNHNCDVQLGYKLVETAGPPGADAIKFQSYTAARSRPAWRPATGWSRRPERHAVGHVRQARQALRPRLQVAPRPRAARGLTAFSTPFDDEAVDFLASLDVPAFKIASADLTCHGSSSARRAWASR